MITNITIATKTPEERSALLAYLITLGFVWHKDSFNSDFTVEEINDTYSWEDYPTIGVNALGSIQGHRQHHTPNYDSFFDNVNKIKFDLKRNTPSKHIILEKCKIGTHTPEVYKDKVKVGCQTFSKGWFDKFYKWALAKNKEWEVEANLISKEGLYFEATNITFQMRESNSGEIFQVDMETLNAIDTAFKKCNEG